MKNFKVLICLIFVLMLSSCATQNQHLASNDFTATCRAMDKNQDGVIDKEEFVASADNKQSASQVFLLCDANKDGVIDMEEAQKAKALMQKRVMKSQALRLTEPR